MHVRKKVLPLLFLAVIGVLLPLTGIGANWLPVIGWTVALIALITALTILLRHNRRARR